MRGEQGDDKLIVGRGKDGMICVEIMGMTSSRLEMDLIPSFQAKVPTLFLEEKAKIHLF